MEPNQLGITPVRLRAGSLLRLQSSKIIDSSFIYLYFQTTDYWKQITENSKGTGQPGLNATILKKMKILLPPLPEQFRIVAKIEELFTEVKTTRQELEKVPNLLKQFHQSVLSIAFKGELVPRNPKDEPASVLLEKIKKVRRKKWMEDLRAKGKDPKKRKYKELDPVDTSRLSDLPEGWEWASTQMVCSSVRDGTHDTPKYVTNGIPLVTSKNLKSKGLDLTGCKMISEKDHKEISKRSGVEPGDILIAMIGTIGNPVVVEEDISFSIKNVGLFKKNPDFLNSKYLKYWLDSKIFWNITIKKELIKGTNQKFIPLISLRSIPIPLPPIFEQKRIIGKIGQLFSIGDQIEQSVQIASNRADKLEKAILAKAFKGELVPQDLDDEPASVLLERIRAEKEIINRKKRK